MAAGEAAPRIFCAPDACLGPKRVGDSANASLTNLRPPITASSVKQRIRQRGTLAKGGSPSRFKAASGSPGCGFAFGGPESCA